MRCRRGRREDASLLLIRRHREHSSPHGVQRRVTEDPRQPQHLHPAEKAWWIPLQGEGHREYQGETLPLGFPGRPGD